MIGEKNIIPELESQYRSFLDFVDKLGLSHNVKIDLYSRFQKELYDRSVKESVEYGRKLEGRKNDTKNIINTPAIEKVGFSDEEESIIEQYVSFFREHGIDAPINYLFTPGENDKILIAEAIKRVKETTRIL